MELNNIGCNRTVELSELKDHNQKLERKNVLEANLRKQGVKIMALVTIGKQKKRTLGVIEDYLLASAMIDQQ